MPMHVGRAVSFNSEIISTFGGCRAFVFVLEKLRYSPKYYMKDPPQEDSFEEGNEEEEEN